MHQSAIVEHKTTRAIELRALAVLENTDDVVLAHNPVDARECHQVEDEAECEQIEQDCLAKNAKTLGKLACTCCGCYCCWKRSFSFLTHCRIKTE